MNSFSDYVRQLASIVDAGMELPLPGPSAAPSVSSSPNHTPTVLIFSPHPDDEVIVGGLPLRLLRRSGWRVINVAVTQGSNRTRQAERWEELTAACQRIGFELVATKPNGLEHITPAAAAEAGPEWQSSVARIRELLEEHQPRLVLFPHEHDWNGTHIGVHLLLRQALHNAELDAPPWVCETEFWGQMPAPNLIVESSTDELADLVAALAFHIGEVRRNPYHLTLPAWMMENVRRAELVVGQGGTVPTMRFGTIYRLGRWNEVAVDYANEGRALLHSDDPACLFPA